MLQPSSASMDETLEALGVWTRSQQLTNVAPLALEAWCAMGRPNAVMPLPWSAA